MTNTQLLLDRARKLCSPPSWYRLAQVLEMHQQTISRVMTKGGGIDNEACFRLGKLLNMDAATVVAYIEEDRAPVERKEFWRSQLPRLLAAFGLALGLSVGSGPRAVHAAEVTTRCDDLYIMRTRRKRAA